MNIRDYLRRYLAERPGLSPAYCRLMEATTRRLCRWTGRSLELEEIDRALLADWLRSLMESGLRPATVNNKATSIYTLLGAAYDEGLLDRPPRRVRRLPENLAPPEAWTVEEVGRLLGHLQTLPDMVGDVPAADWWFSLVVTIYWTGCRISALLKTPTSAYTPGLSLLVSWQKNGHQQLYMLPPSCCAAVERVLPASGRIWAWPYHPRTLWLRFRKYVERAGLPCPTTGRSLFHRIRRTTLSYCAAVDPAIAQRQADHASLETTRRSYLDPRIVGQRSAADVLPEPMLTNQKPILRIVG